MISSQEDKARPFRRFFRKLLKMFTKRECDAVEELRQSIFKICDERLSEWLDKQLKSSAKA